MKARSFLIRAVCWRGWWRKVEMWGRHLWRDGNVNRDKRTSRLWASARLVNVALVAGSTIWSATGLVSLETFISAERRTACALRSDYQLPWSIAIERDGLSRRRCKTWYSRTELSVTRVHVHCAQASPCNTCSLVANLASYGATLFSERKCAASRLI